MSTYKPKNSRLPHKPLNHSVHNATDTKAKAKGLAIAVAGIALGPIILVGGLMFVWWAVAWIIVGIFKVLPSIKV